MVAFLIMGLFIMLAVGIYTYWKLGKLVSFYGLKKEKRCIRIFIIILTLIIAVLCINVWSTSAVIVLHVIVISALLDVVALIINTISKNKEEEGSKSQYRQKKKEKYKIKKEVQEEEENCRIMNIIKIIYGCGILPIIITIVIIGYGFSNIANVVETDYTIQTDKRIRGEGYRIALLTDIHYGTIQDKQVLKDKILEINKIEPDVVLLGGDIVEEGTSNADMQEVFKTLSEIHNKYGIYYVYGNHDKQTYSKDKTYTTEVLEKNIKENGIRILKDEYVTIGDDVILAGRDDAAWGNTSGRASVKKILSGVDQDKYIIMLDHQPIEVMDNSKQGVDLQLSGHTHAGQIWPVGPLSELTGVLNYGKYIEGDCTVIVSSGFAGWGYPIRTGKHSEYVIIDIEGIATQND